MTSPSASTTTWNKAYLYEQLEKAVLNPVRAFRVAYLPLLMIYFAYGALGITAIADSFWVRKELKLSAEELAALGVWLTLPWTIKMVFGELVDTVSIMGSQRRAYVYIGAALVAAGLLMLAAAAAGRLPGMSLETAYRIASLLTVVGLVLQDVVADAMTTEVVPRTNEDGTPRPKEDIDRDLGMVQVLGRLALSLGIFLVAGLGGLLASFLPYSTVFLIALVIPVISATGAALVKIGPVEQRPIDWRILGGGIAFGAVVLLLAIGNVPWNQEIIFIVSMVVVIAMLRRVISDVDAETKRVIFFAALIIFVYRATPGVGPSYAWYSMDVLKFDEAFFGVLAQIGAALALLGMWLFSDAITRQPVARVLLWLTVITTVLSLPNLGLVYGLHTWTERVFGFGAQTIAIIDAAAGSPFAQLSMIPLLTLIAIYAPAGRRASWFALMASLMNLALAAGNLGTKYLNGIFVVPRGDYTNLPMLYVVVLVIGFVVPIAVIKGLGHKLK
jgi:MFS family permease